MISYHPCAGVWNHWKSEVSEFQYPDSATIDFGSMLVPNVDSVRTEYLINAIAKQGKVGSNYRLSSVGWILKSNFFFHCLSGFREQPVMLIGEQGSAKTVMINAYLKKIKNEDHSSRTINFSSATTTYQFQVTRGQVI